MSSFWETKYLSAEKAIEFLQKEHTETLSALHEQIEKLQKRCSELSLELSLRATTSVEKNELLQEHKNFNTEIIKRDQQLSDLKSQINEKTNTVNLLNERIRVLEKRLEAESNFKDETIRQLKDKINEQSSQIAQMTFQLYAVNQENLRKNRKNSLKSPDSNNFETSSQENIIGKEREKRISRASGLNKLKILPVQPLIHRFNVVANDNRSTENVLKRIPSSSTNSSESERSFNSLNQPLKALPLQALRRKGDLIPPPDPKPFLEITGNSDLSREALPPRKLKSLPPIRPLTDVNRLAVESPIKGLGSAGTSSSVSNNKPTV